MSDQAGTTVAAPPSAGSPANSQALLATAAATAQSPLEAGNLDWIPEDAPQPQPGNQIASSADDWARRADAARARDNPQFATQQARQAAQQEQGQHGQQAQATQGEQKAAESALNWKPRKAKDWEAMHAAHNTEKQQLMAKIAELEKGGPQVGASVQQAADISQHPEFVKLKEAHDRYYDEIKHVRVEADPEFKAKYDTKFETAVKIARSVSGQAADDVSKILAIKDPDLRAAQLADRIKDFGDGSKARIMAAAAQISAMEVERDIEVATRKSTWDQRQAQVQAERGQMTKQREGEVRKAFQKELKRWQDPDGGMPFTIPSEKNNKAAGAIAERAENIAFGNLKDDGDLAAVAIKAATFDHVIEYAAKLADEYDALLSRYNSVMGLQPDSAGYNPNPPVGDTVHNAGAGHGMTVPGSQPLVMHDYTGWDQQLRARRQADASRR